MLARTTRMRQVRLLGLICLILFGGYMLWDSSSPTTQNPVLEKGGGQPEIHNDDFETEGKRTLKSSSYDVHFPPACFQINCAKQVRITVFFSLFK